MSFKKSMLIGGLSAAVLAAPALSAETVHAEEKIPAESSSPAVTQELTNAESNQASIKTESTQDIISKESAANTAAVPPEAAKEPDSVIAANTAVQITETDKGNEGVETDTKASEESDPSETEKDTAQDTHTKPAATTMISEADEESESAAKEDIVKEENEESESTAKEDIVKEENEDKKDVSAENDTSSSNEKGFENESGGIALEKLGSYITGLSNKDGGVSEIISYDKNKNEAWTVNGTTGMLDIIDLNPVTSAAGKDLSARSIDMKKLVKEALPDFNYGDMTSVAIHADSGFVAVALQDADANKNGYIAILDTEGNLLTLKEAGKQPDNVVFTPNGKWILSANEGEMRNGAGDGVVDPKGSVTMIDLSGISKDKVKEAFSKTLGFEAFDEKRDDLVKSGVIFRKGAMPSEDFEPEYIAATNDRAFVSLQEANAIAILDLLKQQFEGIYSLGYKDLGKDENAIDLLEDDQYVAKTYPDAVGAYMPDGVAVYEKNGKTYLLTANEGDSREWGSGDSAYDNEKKEKLEASDGTKAKKVRIIKRKVTEGLPKGKDVLFGGRSFSMYELTDTGLTQVFDSGNDFERLTAKYLPDYFNASNDDNTKDSRSRKKGPEAETVTVGKVNGRSYAFIGLERIGGIMVYDITDPENVTFSNYINTRDFQEDPDAIDKDNPSTSLKSDVAPEGLYFIPAADSPSGSPILLGAFEVSGTVSAYSVGETPKEAAARIEKEKQKEDTDNSNSDNDGSSYNDSDRETAGRIQSSSGGTVAGADRSAASEAGASQNTVLGARREGSTAAISGNGRGSVDTGDHANPIGMALGFVVSLAGIAFASLRRKKS